MLVKILKGRITCHLLLFVSDLLGRNKVSLFSADSAFIIYFGIYALNVLETFLNSLNYKFFLLISFNFL